MSDILEYMYFFLIDFLKAEFDLYFKVYLFVKYLLSNCHVLDTLLEVRFKMVS